MARRKRKKKGRPKSELRKNIESLIKAGYPVSFIKEFVYFDEMRKQFQYSTEFLLDRKLQAQLWGREDLEEDVWRSNIKTISNNFLDKRKKIKAHIRKILFDIKRER
ncbi:MAG: hypothetical protein DRP84_09875 [Spirochaetes bacterium]|nr:MAG: hypothetical protein DRP84_09875 [Spirochaetota bacterium]